MKKIHMSRLGLILGIIILFVSVTLFPPIIAQSSNDVTICITAGFFFNINYDEPNNRSIGRTVTIYVVNNLSERIWIFYQVDYSTLSGETLETLGFAGEVPYTLAPDNYTLNAFSNFVQIPCQITMSVQIGSYDTGAIKTVTRSGYQFHRWVFFPKVTEQVG
jgi:hypothetical protein